MHGQGRDLKKDWKTNLALPDASIRQVMQIIDSGGRQIAFVVDGSGRLLGSVTDGDIRRALLRGQGLDAPVTTAMNQNPVIKTPDSDPAELRRLVKERGARQIPVVDRNLVLVGIELASVGVQGDVPKANQVILMAGGLGSRLFPLTQDLPKPMLPVGGRPILETIVSNFARQGFSKIYLSVNYKRDVIENHFGDGSRFGVSIEYLREDTKLGTAGALGLLPEVPEVPMVVMNCDVLTNVKFDHMLDFHQKQCAAATMAVREYDMQVPYGVVTVDENSRIEAIDEKPTHRFFVNAGIYVLSPDVLRVLKSNEQLDMPQLFQRLRDRSECTAAFPVCEYWIDVGQHQDLERAEGEYNKIFGAIQDLGVVLGR